MTALPSGTERRPAAHLVTLGCPKNEVDSEKMRASLAAAGYDLVTELAEADVAILNTCGFIQAAVEESIETILELAEWRDDREGRRLIVAGCLVSRYGSDLGDELEEVDAFVPVAGEGEIAELIASLTGTELTVAASAPLRLDSGPSAYLQISDGCHGACAYCTIPSIRGRYRSQPLEAIVAEAELLVSLGARELVLIGQDISAYGRDLEGPETLADVIRAVAAIEGLEWVRLMYIQPDGVTPELLATIADEPKVCHYLDIPLQHASASVLRAMRRTGSAEEFLKLLASIRAALPDVVLRTTVIAGFPGETEEDAEILERFLGMAEFDYVGVFPYSPEDGTEAATLPDLPPEPDRLERAQRLRDIADVISADRMAALVDSTVVVLSEGLDVDGVPVGRWFGQAPDVDGVVTLDRAVAPGEFAQVRVTAAIGYELEGEVLA